MPISRSTLARKDPGRDIVTSRSGSVVTVARHDELLRCRPRWTVQLTTVDSSQLTDDVRVDRFVDRLDRSSVLSRWLVDDVIVFLELEFDVELTDDPFLTV